MTRFLLVASSLLATVVAQRTVIVDASNGPGTNHTTLTAALNDLQANDLIVLRAGTYTGSTKSTQHSFSIHGEGNPLVVPVLNSLQTMAFTFWGGAAQRVNLSGVRFQSDATGQWALSVGTFQNSWPAPTVHLENCEVMSVSPQADRVGLLAQAVGLTVQSCDLSTTQVIDCVASFETTWITGHDLSVYSLSTQRAQTALDVLRSEVWLIDCTLTAGSSLGAYAEPAACVGFSDNSVTKASRVHVCFNSTLTADAAPHPLWPVPAVFQDYASFWPVDPTVEYEASVVLTPSPTGPVFGPGVVPVLRTITHQASIDAPLGGNYATFVRSGIGDIVLAYASMSSFAQQLGTWELFMDLASAVPIGVGVLTTSPVQMFQVPIPNLPSLVGSVIEITGAALTPTGVLEVTNPSAGIIR